MNNKRLKLDSILFFDKEEIEDGEEREDGKREIEKE